MPQKAADYDVVIVGAGHNGLVCACYLAGAGLKVRVLERRKITGGAAVTEEFHPGFRNSTASYTVGLLHPKVISDLNLKQNGLEIIERPIANFLPLPGQQYLKTGHSTSGTQTEFARHSQHDAEQLPAYYQMLNKQCEWLRGLFMKTPPRLSGGLLDTIDILKTGFRLSKLSVSEGRDLLTLLTGSAGDMLDSWFECDAVKALFGFDSVVGNFASPYTPGSGYVLLHHVWGEVNGRSGIWGHARGGMGAVTRAIEREALSRGVDITTGSEVKQISVTGNTSNGVILDSGELISAARIAANVNPRLLYLDLIDPVELDEEFLRRIKTWKCSSGSFRMNVALSELPDFSCLPGTHMQEHHQSGIIIGPSLQYMDRAYHDAKLHGWSKQPVIEMLIPSTLDPELAPAGQHVASLFCQQFSPNLPGTKSWDEHKQQAAELIIDTVNHYAPNFRQSILGTMVLSPLDLERQFGLIGGDIFHGAMSLDQLYSARPMLGYGDYRGPIKGLYMCGSGTHPGGGVSGIPGHNAAREIIKDYKKAH